MKTLSSYTVPKWARHLTGEGNSPQLVDNSTFLGRLGLLNPFRWLNQRITQRQRVNWPVGAWFLILTLCSFSAHAGIISTVAGTGTSGYSGDGGAATSAQLYAPKGVAVDSSGNLYIADYLDPRIRKVTSSGTISTVAGTGTSGFSGDGGAATSARLNTPSGVAVDSSGNLYIADETNHRVRKVTSGGVISTVAGTGTGGYSGDGGAATSAQLDSPSGVAVDSSGNLYIADYGNQRLRKVTPGGIISTVAGTGTMGFSGDGGAATSAQLYYPSGVAVDSSGNLYIADNNQRIRKVTGGIISTVAGTGTFGYSDDGGAATSAPLNFPQGVAVDSSGNLYIADKDNHSIRKVTTGGIISTVAGNGTGTYGGDGGAATSAQLDSPTGVAVDSSGNLYIADYFNNRIRKVILVPQIDVQGNSTSIASGDTTPVTTDNTDFGSTPVGTPVSKTFTIANTGEGILNLTGSPKVSVTGSGFSVTTQPTSPVAATTGTTNFVIQFLPTASGVSNGTVSIANNDSLNNPYTFSITGTGSSNTAPTANNGSLTTNEDTAGSGTVTASDANGDSLTYSLVTNGSKGSATITASTGAYTYTPTLNQNGTDTFTFKANDGTVDSNIATMTVTITPVNDAPVITQGASTSVTMSEDGSPTAWSTPTISATDVDGDTLTWSLNTAALHGSATVSGTGASPSITYVPTTNYNGPDSFVAKVSDGSLTATITVNVTITAVNDAPVITGQAALSTNEDTPLTLSLGNLTVTDVDNTYPTGFSLTVNTGANYTVSGATITPSANFNGTLTVPVVVNDGAANSNTYNLTVTVNAVNDAPVASNSTLTTNEDTAGSGTLTASDLDANSLIYSIVTDGTKGTATIASTGAYTYTPSLNQNGSDTFTFKVNDGTADSNIATMTVTITAVNDPPTLTTFSAPLDTTAEDTEVELTFAELTTQGDESDSADAINSGTVTSFIVQAVSTGTLKIGTAVGTATAYAAGTNETIDATHQAYWTPALNANGTLNAFTVKAKDNSGALSTTAVQTQVIVTAVNDAPVASNGSLTTNEDTVGSGTLTASDLDANPLTYSVVTNGSKGTANITNASTGAYTYTPNLNQNGSDTFTFKVNDGTVDSNIATVTVTITPVNDAPVASNGTLTTNEDTAGSSTLSAADVDANPLTYSIVTNGSKGTATITNTSTGAYTYTPSLNQNGTDTFTFKANDGTVDSNIATVTVTITPVNDAPVASNGTLTTNEDTAGSGTLSASDVEANPLTYSIVANGSKGTATITNASTGAYTYTPSLNQNGTDTFTFKANDGTVDSNIATITVTITPVNDAPVATAGSLTTLEDTVGNGTVSATDVENSPLTYTVVTNGTKGTAVITPSTGAYTYTPNANVNGSDSFTFKANDGTADSTPATITVTITPVNDQPAFTASDPPAVLENTGLHTLTGWATFNPGPNETDSVLAYTVSNVSTPGLFAIPPSVDTSGTLTYTLAANQSGASTFTVTVQDNGGTTNGGIDTSAPTTFTVSVSAPEINLTQNTQTLLNGTGTYDFGNVLQTTSTAAITFTIDNLGTADLILGNPKLLVGGTDASDFSLNDTTQSPIPPGGNTTFTLTFTPPTVGLRTATLTIASNDSDEGNYTIALQGTGTFSKIQAKTADTAVPIANGGVYNFGDALVGSRASPVTLLLENQGTGMLLLTGTPMITIIEGDQFDFGIDSTATSNGIVANSNTRFTANFMPSIAGLRRAVVKIANNDLTQSSYIITLLGTGVEPDLQVTQGDLTLISGAPYDMGTMLVSGTTPPVTFTFENLGTAPLYLYDNPPVHLTGTYANNFTVDSSKVTNPIAPGGQMTFTLTFHPLTPGVKTAQLEIRNSDLDEGGYFIALSGLGITPEIQVLQGTTNLRNGGSYAFGDAAVGVVNSPVTVTIKNLGTADLTLTDESPRVKVTGENASDFSVTETGLAPVIPVGASTSFTVTFTPTTEGPKTATLTFLNSDLDEYNYTLQLTGTGREFGCDAQGTVPLTDNKTCAWSGGQATFTIDPNLPNHGDGNGDGIVDAKQTHVATLKDQVTGEYLTLEVDPSCEIAALYTDLPEHYPGYNKRNPFPQGMTYFDLKCSQTTVSIYQHGMTKLLPNLRYQKYGQLVPGDDSSIGWYRLPEAKFTKVLIGDQPVIKVTYFLKDGELGDNTGVDGHIVDPGGLTLAK